MEQTKEISPDELMEDFRGRSVTSIVIFTIVAHLIVLVVAVGVPFLWGLVMGSDVKELSEETRKELAVKEARASLTEIAKEYGLKSVDDLSRQMAGGARPASKPKAVEPVAPASDGEGEGAGEPKSAIEKELEKVEAGPDVPPVPEDEEEDLFK